MNDINDVLQGRHPNDPKVMIDWLKGRILDYLKNPMRGQMFGHLMGEFGLAKGKYLPRGLPESRALDRALQQLRKEGKIRYERRQWWLA